jgi:hypothetical protein
MYSMHGSAIQTDWLQLGLMVCWVVDPGLGLNPGEEGEGTYHTNYFNPHTCTGLLVGLLISPNVFT